VDESCDNLDQFIEEFSSSGREPDSIVVFGSTLESERGAIPWGEEGAEVLSMISDILDRKNVLRDTDTFLKELRDSNERLESEKRRFSRLVLQHAEMLRGANVALSREVDALKRLQSLARFFAAPGPDDSFAQRLSHVAGRALGAAGAAVAFRRFGEWTIEGLWKISFRNASSVIPPRGEAANVRARTSSRKGFDVFWLPVGTEAGLSVLSRTNEGPEGTLGERFLESCLGLLAEGIAARLTRETLLSRKVQSERIVHTLRGGLLKTDEDGRVTLANPACGEILGRRPAELEGRTLSEIFGEESHLLRIVRPVLEGASSIDDVETSVTWPSGRRVSVSVRASRLGADRAGRGGAVVLLADLSKRKEVEEEVRRADRLAALGRLSAGVAHEIRNPLAGIRTTAEILGGRVKGDAELARFVDVILEETSRLDRIVGSLLQFAKPPVPRLSPFELAPVFEKVRQLTSGRCAERRVTLHTTLPANLPRFRADRDQILQVLLNLTLNAVEASPERTEVFLFAEVEEDHLCPQVKIVVEDQGQGVPAALTGRIFDPFFTTKPGGTGLGLSISQNILTSHGGRIRVESAPHGGTRAIVHLPLKPDARTPRIGDGKWPTS
jgi:PAS domain S-box-containing protein